MFVISVKKKLSRQDKVFILQEVVTWSEIEYYNVKEEVDFGSCIKICSEDDGCAGFNYKLNGGVCKVFHYSSQYFSAGKPGIGDHLIYYLQVDRQAARGELPPNKSFQSYLKIKIFFITSIVTFLSLDI